MTLSRRFLVNNLSNMMLQNHWFNSHIIIQQLTANNISNNTHELHMLQHRVILYVNKLRDWFIVLYIEKLGHFLSTSNPFVFRVFKKKDMGKQQLKCLSTNVKVSSKIYYGFVICFPLENLSCDFKYKNTG